jgi:hypothetical protein
MIFFCVRIGFCVDPDLDLAFYLGADPYPYPDPVQASMSQKVKFLHKKYTVLKYGKVGTEY